MASKITHAGPEVNPQLIYTDACTRNELMDNEFRDALDHVPDGEDESLMEVDNGLLNADFDIELPMDMDNEPEGTVPVDANDPTSDIYMVDPIDAITYRMSNLSIFEEHYDHVHDLGIRLAKLNLTPDTQTPTIATGNQTS